MTILKRLGTATDGTKLSAMIHVSAIHNDDVFDRSKSITINNLESSNLFLYLDNNFVFTKIVIYISLKYKIYFYFIDIKMQWLTA
jgi:hypothetical protein